jgi:hypothetical protein
MEPVKAQPQNGDTKQEETATAAVEVRSETRRRLLKAGVLSVPVIMTVYSRPVFAQIGSVDDLVYGEYGETGTLEPDSSLPEQDTSTSQDSPFDDLNFSKSRGGSSARDSRF